MTSIRNPVLAALSVTALFFLFASLQDAPAQEDAGSVAEDHEGKNLAMHDAMEELQASQRKLRRLLRDPANTDHSAALLRTMQQKAIVAFAYAPPVPDGMDPGAVPAYNVEFRRQILNLADELCVCELAVLEGRNEDADASFKTLVEIKNSAHERFQIEEE